MADKPTVESLTKKIAELERLVAEEKKAQKALRESEEKYRTIIERIEDGYFEVDLAGNFTFFNEPMREMLGYTRDELMGVNNRAYMDEKNARLVFHAFNRVYKTGNPLKAFDWELIAKDGSTCIIETSVALRNDARGQPVGFMGIARDVTKRKRTERALLESEEKYRLLADNAEDVIFTLDLDLTYTYVSPSVKLLRGFEPEEVIGRGLDQTLSTETFSSLSQIIAEEIEHVARLAAESTPARVFELEMRKKDGSWVWAEVKASFLRDEEGRPIGIVGVTRDITERRKAERILLKSKERYEKAQKIGKVGNWEYDIQTEKFWGSKEAKRIYGFDPDVDSFTTDEVESCIPERGRVHRALVDLIERGKPYHLEFEIITKNTHQRKTLLSLAELEKNERNTPIRVSGVVQDITGRKEIENALHEREAKYRLLAENSADVIWSTDKALKFDYVSPSVKRVFGYEVEEVLGQHIVATLSSEDREIAFDVVSKMSRLGDTDESRNAPTRLELRQRRKDGTLFWTEILINPLRDESGEFVGIQGTTRDIDARRQAEEQVRQLQKAESLGRLAGAVAHHFNNMLAIIAGNLEILREEGSPEEDVRDMLDEAQDATQRATEISRLMLTYLGQQTVKATPLDLSELITAIESNLRARMPKSATLDVRIVTPGTTILGDSSQIEQIITALVTNAWESIEPSMRGETVTLSVDTAAPSEVEEHNRFPVDWEGESKHYVCLSVTDMGKGIPQDELGKIFDPFFSDKFTGRGLGLAIVLGQVKTLDGCITVESSKGKGSTFRVYLPAAE